MPRVDSARLKTLPGVLGVIDSDAQLQIVLGPAKRKPQRKNAGDAEQRHARGAGRSAQHCQRAEAADESEANQRAAPFLSCFATILPR